MATNASRPIPILRPVPAAVDAAAPPVSIMLDEYATLDGLTDMLSYAAYADGSEPFARCHDIDRLVEDAELIPSGAVPFRVIQTERTRSWIARGDGWTVRSWRNADHSGRVTVTARTAELATAIVDDVVGRAAAPVPDDDEVSTRIGFWLHQRREPRRSERTIDAPAWDDIAGNYNAAARAALAAMMAVTSPDGRGRLVLLHGPPGTGKTTAVRALARAWRPWCTVDFVVDADRLLNEPGYLLHVLVDHSDDDRWRLLVLEDCDELLRHDAKSGTGQSLSRLLNVTDGLLGHGSRVLVCLTTNEELGRLHPAVVRAGRCLARVFVDRFDREEARAWLGADAERVNIPAAGATLAELCELRGELTPVRLVQPDSFTGQYL